MFELCGVVYSISINKFTYLVQLQKFKKKPCLQIKTLNYNLPFISATCKLDGDVNNRLFGQPIATFFIEEWTLFTSRG